MTTGPVVTGLPPALVVRVVVGVVTGLPPALVVVVRTAVVEEVAWPPRVVVVVVVWARVV